MSIRLDPRRLGALKQLAAESGVRPGELVLRWVEERLDAARGGGQGRAAQAAAGPPSGLASRIDELAARIARLEAADRAAQAPESPRSPTADAPSAKESTPDAPAAAAKRGKTRRPVSGGTTNGDQPRVALHDEIIAVVAERGPMTAAELASAITERGRYMPPRSGKALDATTVSARVSNPTYRGRFRRREGRIELADPE